MANIVELPECINLESLNYFLENFDCNNILVINKIIYMDKISLAHLEKYILKYSVRLIERTHILNNVRGIYQLDFLKNMVDHQLLQLIIPSDVTNIFINMHNFIYNIDIFKWYYYSGWKFNYDSSRVFQYILEYVIIDDIKWWHENNLPRDYTNTSLHITLARHLGEDLNYILNIILEDGVVHNIKYFNYIRRMVDMYIHKNNFAYLHSSDIIKVTDFCIKYGADFTIKNIVNNYLLNMEYVINLDPKINELFEYCIMKTMSERILTDKEVYRLYYFYVFSNYLKNLPKTIIDLIENILQLPIVIDLNNHKINNIIFKNLLNNMAENKERIDDLIKYNKIHVIDKN